MMANRPIGKSERSLVTGESVGAMCLDGGRETNSKPGVLYKGLHLGEKKKVKNKRKRRRTS